MKMSSTLLLLALSSTALWAETDGLPPVVPSYPKYDSERAESLALGVIPAPTEAEIAKLSAEEKAKQARAIKHALLTLELLQGKKFSVEAHRAAAEIAKKQGAPAGFVSNYLLLAESKGAISGRAQYFVREALAHAIARYDIHLDKIRYFARRNKLSYDKLQEELHKDSFPWNDAFNQISHPNTLLIPNTRMTEAEKVEVEARYTKLCKIFQEIIAIYGRVKDEASVGEAAAELKASMKHYDILLHFYQGGDAQLSSYVKSNSEKDKQIKALTQQLHNLRAELREQNFFGSTELRIIDTLLI